jgi:hypothetical protein
MQDAVVARVAVDDEEALGIGKQALGDVPAA